MKNKKINNMDHSKILHQWNRVTDKMESTLLINSLHINLIPHEMTQAYIDRKWLYPFYKSDEQFFPTLNPREKKKYSQFLWHLLCIQGKHHVYLLN